MTIDLLPALIECRELAAKGSKFCRELTREAIEEGLVLIDEAIRSAQEQLKDHGRPKQK